MLLVDAPGGLQSATMEKPAREPPSGRDSSATRDNPMVLRMIDWRGCSAVEYVPGRKGGQATFLGRRIPAQALADWLSTGRTPEEFSDVFEIELDSVMDAVRYLNDDPPVGTVDLTGCAAVQLNPWDMPSFKGTTFPVESLFDFLKAGRKAREFSETYGMDHGHVEAVLSHAAAQNYQGPTR